MDDLSDGWSHSTREMAGRMDNLLDARSHITPSEMQQMIMMKIKVRENLKGILNKPRTITNMMNCSVVLHCNLLSSLVFL